MSRTPRAQTIWNSHVIYYYLSSSSAFEHNTKINYDPYPKVSEKEQYLRSTQRKNARAATAPTADTTLETAKDEAPLKTGDALGKLPLSVLVPAP